jgi:hypothetical protein
MASFRRYAQIQIAALILAVGSALALSAGPMRTGWLIGVAAASISTVAVMPALASALADSLQKALAAIVGAFLGRMVLVGLGLILCHKLGGDLLACTAGFFIPYLVCQVVEVTFVSGRSKSAAAQGVS